MKALPALLAAALFPTIASAQSADAGRLVYADRCAICHGPALQGTGAPPLSGTTFLAKWTGRPAADLYKSIAETMPVNAVGQLQPVEYRQVTAYVMAQNGFAPTAKILVKGDASTALEPPAPEPVLPALPESVARATGSSPAESELVHPADSDWPIYNRDYRGQRFSPLAQITPANAKTLAPTCIFQAGEAGAFQTSPLIYKNRIYLTTTHDTFAVDAVSCKKIWGHVYVPPGEEGLPVNRGAALYEGKLLRGTSDGHLLALDAETGKLLWDLWVANSKHGYNLNGAPVAFGGKVYVGQGGADRGATGHIYAFDLNSGKRVWTFDVVPTGKEPGADTWAKGTELGGGSSWSTITVDPEKRLLFVPTGNPGADLDGALRPGANLYTDAVVVLNADTGKLAWYVQQEPHDTHDWDTSAPPAIYDLGDKKFLAAATKGGWLYLYDRTTRKQLAKQEIDSHENIDKPLSTSVEMHVCPGTLGGAEWFGPSVDTASRTLFVNSVDWCGLFKVEAGSARNTFGGSLKFDPVSATSGWLRAFDAATGKPLWTYHSPTPMVAGVTPTAGGVVFTGQLDGDFLAFDAKTGAILYRFPTGGAIAGGVSTFAVDGRQYVAVASGNASRTIWSTTGSPTLIVFGLPKTN